MKKIIAGLAVVVVAAGVIKVVSTNNKPVEQEEIVQVETGDVSDHLYEDTFTGEDDIYDEIDDSEIDVEMDVNNNLDDTSSNIADSNKEESSNSEQSKTVSGEFQGFADSSFVEIKVGDNYDMYRVTDGIKSKLSSKTVGQTITFTYIESAGQNVITDVK